jgi:hypothetical protein
VKSLGVVTVRIVSWVVVKYSIASGHHVLGQIFFLHFRCQRPPTTLDLHSDTTHKTIAWGEVCFVRDRN